jgi:hypothetical protein
MNLKILNYLKYQMFDLHLKYLRPHLNLQFLMNLKNHLNLKNLMYEKYQKYFQHLNYLLFLKIH